MRVSCVTASQCGAQQTANVDDRASEGGNCKTPECKASEVNLWSTEFETSVSAVSISRQQN